MAFGTFADWIYCALYVPSSVLYISLYRAKNVSLILLLKRKSSHAWRIKTSWLPVQKSTLFCILQYKGLDLTKNLRKWKSNIVDWAQFMDQDSSTLAEYDNTCSNLQLTHQLQKTQLKYQKAPVQPKNDRHHKTKHLNQNTRIFLKSRRYLWV